MKASIKSRAEKKLVAAITNQGSLVLRQRVDTSVVIFSATAKSSITSCKLEDWLEEPGSTPVY